MSDILAKIPKEEWDRLLAERDKPKPHRYISLAKFIDLLETKRLYLPKAALLPDKSEGVIISRKARMRMRAMSRALRGYKGLLHGEAPAEATPEEADEEQRDKLEDGEQELRRFFCFLSCWHDSSHESFAMWKLYIPSTEGVCIQTSRERLTELVEAARIARPTAVVQMKDVQYGGTIDQSDDLAPFFRKGRAYNYENEVRVAVSYYARYNATWEDDRLKHTPERREMFSDGIQLDINPAIFIERVVVHPQGGHWLKELVGRQLERVGMAKGLLAESELEDSL